MPDSNESDRPNVLLIVADQHNPRFREGYSTTEHGEPVSTPTLDKLADESTVFEWAYCGVPLCTPSRLCFLSGREAADVGAWGNESMLPKGLVTIPKAFSNAGYETGLVGKMHLGGDRQFGGFDYRPYGDLTGRAGHQYEPPDPQLAIEPKWEPLLTETGVTNIPESLLQEQNVVRESISFLREHRNRSDDPWFLCASFNRPHWPRTAPRRCIDEYWPDGVTPPTVTPEQADTADHPMARHRRRRYAADQIDEETTLRARASYFACVEYVDEILGDLFTQLEADGFLENTIVVYISDHGEMAGEHGLWEKNTWHEGSCRVPFFVSLPENHFGQGQPDRVETPVSLLDLYPTLTSLVDVEPPDGLAGHDLSPTLVDRQPLDREPVVVDNFTPYSKDINYRVVRDGTYKYVRFRDSPDLFFDLSEDPLEQRNLMESSESTIKNLREELRSYALQTLDFEYVDERYEQDQAEAKQRQLPIPRGKGNTYHMPDGRIIDADSFLYYPHVLCTDPEAVFADYSTGPEQDNV